MHQHTWVDGSCDVNGKLTQICVGCKEERVLFTMARLPDPSNRNVPADASKWEMGTDGKLALITFADPPYRMIGIEFDVPGFARFANAVAKTKAIHDGLAAQPFTQHNTEA